MEAAVHNVPPPLLPGQWRNQVGAKEGPPPLLPRQWRNQVGAKEGGSCPQAQHTRGAKQPCEKYLMTTEHE